MIKERVTQRLHELKLSQFAAAEKAGRGAHFIYDFLTGKKKDIKGKGAVQIATALQCSVEYLTGESDDVGSPPGSSANFPPQPNSSKIIMAGVIEADVFRRPSAQAMTSEFAGIEPDARYPDVEQRAFLNRGSGLSAVGILDGMIVTTVSVADYEDKSGRIGNDDIIVLRFSRDAGREVEISARRLKEYSDRIEFVGCDVAQEVDTITIRDKIIERQGIQCGKDTSVEFLGVVIRGVVRF